MKKKEVIDVVKNFVGTGDVLEGYTLGNFMKWSSRCLGRRSQQVISSTHYCTLQQSLVVDQHCLVVT